MSSFLNFEIIYFSIIYYDRSTELIQNVAYDYDDFQHVNFIFSQNFISQSWGLFNDETDLRIRYKKMMGHLQDDPKPTISHVKFSDFILIRKKEWKCVMNVHPKPYHLLAFEFIDLSVSEKNKYWHQVRAFKFWNFHGPIHERSWHWMMSILCEGKLCIGPCTNCAHILWHV